MSINSNVPNNSSETFTAAMRLILELLIPTVGIFFILDVPLTFFRISYFSQQFIIVFFSLTTALLFLTKPAKAGGPKNNPQWYDIVLAFTTLILGGYVFYFYPSMVMTAGIIWPIQIVFGIIVTILVIEGIRRTSGMTVPIVILIFIAYAKWGYLLHGILSAAPLTWSRLWQQLLIGSDAMLGIALRIACGTVFGFIFFGEVYLKLGAGEFIMDLSTSLLRKVRGGPAKLAVISSLLFGTISGSAVANVVATGMYTIPLMKKTGYPPYYAGAVESVASTGGQLMPPVMGAAAFVMAAYLGVPYQTVCIVAIIPALLYYFGLFVQVDSQAGKIGLGSSLVDIKPIGSILKKGWVLIPPIVALIYTLFVLYLEPAFCTLIAIVVAYLCALFTKSTRASFWHLKAVKEEFQRVSRSMFSIISISAGAGLIIGVVAYTGLGISFSQILVMAAGGSLFFLALLVAIASAILGMGMPTTPAYIMLAVLAVPAMLKLGVTPMIAHLFVFYFGTLSMITPPICLAVFAAATISGAKVNTIGWQAVKLGIAGFIVPFIFLFNPALALVSGTGIQRLVVIAFTFVAIYLVAVFFEGYALKNILSLPVRLLAILGAVILIIPNPGFIHLELLVIKTVVLLLVLFFIYIITKKNKTVISEKLAV
jgi:TRAP transporter 4TM/12TM fusion protein